ncbi:MAG: phosphoribosyltransferase [Gammaproteobacteria bacterium]
MSEDLPCLLITWEEVYSLCRRLVRQLLKAGFRIDVIVAIARGGYVPARILSDMLGIHDLTGFKIEHYQGTHELHKAFIKYPLNANINGRNVLLMDDICDSGDTLAIGTAHIHDCGAVNELRTAALHFKTVSKLTPDFYAESISEWRWYIYPWAINEDLSSMIANLRLENPDTAELQRQIKRRHGIEVGRPQIEDALLLLQNTGKR